MPIIAETARPNQRRGILSLFVWMFGIVLVWPTSLVIFSMCYRPGAEGAGLMEDVGDLIKTALLYMMACLVSLAVPITYCVLQKIKIPRQFWYSCQCVSFLMGLFGLIGATSVASDASRMSSAIARSVIDSYMESADVYIIAPRAICLRHQHQLATDSNAKTTCDAVTDVSNFLKEAHTEKEWKEVRSQISTVTDEPKAVCVGDRPVEKNIVDLTNEYDVPINISCGLSQVVSMIDLYFSGITEANKKEQSHSPTEIYGIDIGTVVVVRFLGIFALAYVSVINMGRIVADYLAILDK